jgi:YegS/Rv2252/BmrU family lipid kinase
VIFNPTAKGNRARHFLQHLGWLRVDCALKPTTLPGGGRLSAMEAVRDGYDTIVAAGGDGTVNEVLNGIADASNSFEKVQVGVLPLGTMNVYARELGLPLQWERAWAVIQRGIVRHMDLAVAEFGPAERRERRCFAQLAGAGLDARAVELVDLRFKKKVGPAAYVVAALRAMQGGQVPITVEVGSTRMTGELVLVGNGRLYGGPFTVFPNADLGDGRLDVCVFPKVTWRTAIVFAAGLLFRRALPRCCARHLQAESLTLTSPVRVPLQLDGEAAGELPAAFSVHRKSLRVLVS